MWQISNWTLCSLSACTTTILLDTVHPTVHVHMYVVRYTLCVLCICYTLYTIRYTLYAIKKTWQPLEAGSYKKVSTAANQAKGWLVTSTPAAEPENPTKTTFLESNKFQPNPVKVVWQEEEEEKRHGGYIEKKHFWAETNKRRRWWKLFTQRLAFTKRDLIKKVVLTSWV